jgi:hypothetical protein
LKLMRTALIASTLGLAMSACSKHDSTAKPLAGTNTSASPTSSVIPSATASASVPHLTQVKPECRALAVTGKATVDGVPIVTGSLLDGEHWVVLETGSSVSLRHTLTSRELKLIGPGLVLPCRHGAEQILLSSGRLSTSSNLGVRPGAEVLIATPSGTIRYGDAALDVEIGAKGLRMRVKEGEAWLEPEKLGVPPFKNPVHSPNVAALPLSKATATELTEACKAAAETAAESARRLLGVDAPQASSSLGERAAAQVRDRAAARAACAVSAAAAGSVTDPAERQSLWASIAHSEELWQNVPRAVSAQKN